MGLDQWLYTNSRKVCQDANGSTDEFERDNIANNVAITWRKANAIHAWFVAHVQGGEDDCGTYEVEPADLLSLLEACKDVLDSTELVDARIRNGSIMGDDGWVPNWVSGQKLENSAVAEALLPTQSGFHFGGIDYDQWYWWDLQYTAAKLEEMTKNLIPFGWNGAAHKDEPDWRVRFYYSSSW